VAAQVVDQLLVSHPPQAAGGTVVTLRHRLRRPAVLAPGQDGRPATRPAGPRFAVDTSAAAGASARAVVRGPVDVTTADLLARRLLSVSRGGTVALVADLTGVTQLASAGIRALYAVSEQLAAHGQGLTLVTAPASAAQAVLDLVRLDHVTGDEAAPGSGRPGGGRTRQVRSAEFLPRTDPVRASPQAGQLSWPTPSAMAGPWFTNSPPSLTMAKLPAPGLTLVIV
jgi:anti-anti-sigma regulatory factor